MQLLKLNSLIISSCLAVLLLFSFNFASGIEYYGHRYCSESGYQCLTVKKGQSWESLFPDPQQRNVVKKLNRINIKLYNGFKIAIPDNLAYLNELDVSPMPKNIAASDTNTVVVEKAKLAWGAYDTDGRLVKWGPMSGGKNYCADVNRSCKTISGNFTVYRMQGEHCESSKYPIEDGGGAKMPWCMHFYRGYALHGSHSVPGYHASHGCVRMFIEDAEWLNKNFVKTGYTKVIVR